MTTVRVTRKGADRLAAGHPWIYSSDVQDRGGASPGDVVRVVDARNQLLGTAHYSSTSQITLRFLSRRAVAADSQFFLERIEAAERHRQRVVDDSEAYRLIHGEADFLPGLIVDRYGDYLSVQTLDQGMDRARETIYECLRQVVPVKGIVERNDAATRALEGLDRGVAVVWGEVPERVLFRMNGLELEVDLARGQKTGLYLDQRENYLAAARFARGRALDLFASSGGFALHMAPRSETVEAVDSSATALNSARANAGRNGRRNIHFLEANAFDLLASHDAARRRFGTVVLDPPAFAKNRASLDAALRGYKEINLRAMRLLEPGGTLITCSCSHHVSEALFVETVAEAALDARRTVRVLERRTQSADHPVLLTVPETLYLKCLILEVG